MITCGLKSLCWLLTGCWDQLTGTGVACSAVWTYGGAVGSETTEDQGGGWPPAAAQLWVTSVCTCVCMCICDKNQNIYINCICSFHFFLDSTDEQSGNSASETETQGWV